MGVSFLRVSHFWFERKTTIVGGPLKKTHITRPFGSSFDSGALSQWLSFIHRLVSRHVEQNAGSTFGR